MKKLRPLLEDENVQARLVVAAFFILFALTGLFFM